MPKQNRLAAARTRPCTPSLSSTILVVSRVFRDALFRSEKQKNIDNTSYVIPGFPIGRKIRVFPSDRIEFNSIHKKTTTPDAAPCSSTGSLACAITHFRAAIIAASLAAAKRLTLIAGSFSRMSLICMRAFDPVWYVSPSMLEPHPLSIHGNISLLVLFCTDHTSRVSSYPTSQSSTIHYRVRQNLFIFLNVTPQTPGCR